MSVRVLKLGGSLLDLPGLAAVVGRWLAKQQPLASVMLVGGGALADAIRAADRTHALGEAASHALCLDVLGVTAGLAREIFTGASLRTHVAEVDRHPDAALQIFDARQFLSDELAAGGESLPASWQVTSDSIAAHLACALDATELVLLKSSLPAGELALRALADGGFVDEFFPRALGCRSVRIVNIRDPRFPERTLIASPS